ncbi:MAG: hypothetical protein JWO98_5064 [Frankiales bacterium]|nr:hypothetical protein [Frankiales bacterium]
MATTTEPTPRLFGDGRQMLQREAARWWWVPLVGAVVWFVIAWLVLRANYSSLATVGVLVAVVFLIATVNEVALAAVVSGGWRVVHIALAVLFVLGALWGFIRPVNTFFALASVLGLLLFLQGLFALMRGIALKDESSTWWLDLVGGGLLITLACGSPRPIGCGPSAPARRSSWSGWASSPSTGASPTSSSPSSSGASGKAS